MIVRVAGFTLLELALVMLIVGLLLSATLTPLRAQLENRARRQTAADLDRAVEALAGFALRHGRLPCPDASDSADGFEDRIGEARCETRDGLLPSADLAVQGRDAWGNQFRYHLTARTAQIGHGSNFAAVDDGYCAADDGDLDLCERGQLVVRTRGDDLSSEALESKHDLVLANAVPAVVLSHGANGHGRLSGPGSQPQSIPARNLDERENINGNGIFYARLYTAKRTACADNQNEALPLCEFDDIVRWVSPTILNNRLVSAGRLP